MVHFDAAYLLRTLPLLWEGMQVTLLLTALSLAGGGLLGAVLAVLRLARTRTLALAAAVYVNFFRSLPLILLIFWFYFLVPLLVGHSVGGFYSALIGFILFEAAHFCEI